MKREIWHRVGVQATPSAVFLALTDVKRLAQWWTTDTRGESLVGKKLEFRFGQFTQAMQVTTLEEDRLVRWIGSENGAPDWLGTEIEFLIESDDKKSFVFFKHSGWKEDSEMIPHYSMKWATFLLSLKDLLETGKGRPSPHDISVGD